MQDRQQRDSSTNYYEISQRVAHVAECNGDPRGRIRSMPPDHRRLEIIEPLCGSSGGKTQSEGLK